MPPLTPAQIQAFLAAQQAITAAAALEAKSRAEIKNAFIKQAKLQQEVNSGLDGYLEALKTLSKTQKTINENKKKEGELQKEISEAFANRDLEAFKLARKKLEVLKEITGELQKQSDELKEVVKEAKVAKMTFASMTVGLIKGFNKLPGLVQDSFGKIKSLGIFEMDKAIKKSTLEMGLLGSQARGFNDTVREAALTTNEWGMGVQELAKLQSSYSEELGRTVMLGDAGLKSMSALAAATSLGVEGAAKLAGEMDNQGLSAERTSKFVEQTMNDSSSMGLNATKVIKNIQSNIKMLNKYNFKNGVKGLAKMAETVTKLGVSMEFASGMADKLFDIEGAVDMSAQLQVMGGKWAQLADPFKLMYMARNDMEGLTKALGEASESAVSFNKTKGEFEISAMEMHRLRKIAEQTGVAYEDLATAGKNARKMTEIKRQGGFKFGKDEQEFLAATAQFNEKGEAYVIDVKGDKKFIKDLGVSYNATIAAQIKEKKSLEARAKDAQSFDEKVTNLINMIKTTLLPISDGLNEVLGPLIKDVFASKDFKKDMKTLGKEIGEFVKFGAGVIKTIAEMALYLGPKGTLITVLLGKGILSAAQWILNGMALAKGFQLAGGGAGGMGGMAGGLRAVGGGSGMKGAAIAGGLGIGGVLLGAGVDATTDKGSTANILGKGAAGALQGAAMGAMLGPIGMGVGALIGGLAGGYMAYKSKDETSEAQGDAMFGSPIHDGVASIKSSIGDFNKALGSDYSKGRGIVQGGKITPIDNKDDLMAFKPKGPVDNALKGNNTSGTINHTFDDVKVKVEVTVNGSSGQSAKELSELISNNNQVKNTIVNAVNSSIDRNKNQKIKPS